MKLNIVFPKRDEGWYDAALGKISMPVAPTYLAALTPQDIEIKIYDMMAGDTIDYEDDVEMVAITVRTPQSVKAYEIADKFRKKNIAVILGGPHVTISPLEAIEHADSLIVGEAEETWKNLLSDFRKNKLKKFFIGGPFKTDNLNGDIFHIQKRPSLNGLPHLRRDLLPRKRYFMDSIFTSRGCCYGCSFCGVPDLFGSHFRRRPIEEVVSEVETLPSSFLNIDDSIFGSVNDNQYYFDLYGELAKLPKKRYWSGEGALSVVSFDKGYEILKRAADSGLFQVIVGLESIHAQGLNQVRVRSKLGISHAEDLNSDKIKNAIKTIQDFGIEIFAFFVFGLDDDTLDTFQKTLDFCHKTKVVPMITLLSPTPDSPLYKQFKKDGRLLTNLGWNQLLIDELIFQHPSLTEKEIVNARYRVLSELYNFVPLMKRVINSFRYRPSATIFFGSLFSQLGISQAIKKGQKLIN